MRAANTILKFFLGESFNKLAASCANKFTK